MLDRVVMIGIKAMPGKVFDRIQRLCSNPIEIFENLGEDALKSASTAEVLLTSIYLPYTAKEISQCKRLKYIGVYGTKTTQIDLAAAKRRGIQVQNVTNYCDTETAEFILMELLMMARGTGPVLWKKDFLSLEGKHLGIIGSGSVGQKLAGKASALGLKVSYFSRSRKPAIEKGGIQYLEKKELLKQSDIISLHTPPFVRALDSADFREIKNGSIIISTCQGTVWDPLSMGKWLERSENRLILDEFAFSQLDPTSQEKLSSLLNVRISPVAAYDTKDSSDKIAEIFVRQFEEFVANYVATKKS